MTGQAEGVGGPTGTLILDRGYKGKNRDTESGLVIAIKKNRGARN